MVLAWQESDTLMDFILFSLDWMTKIRYHLKLSVGLLCLERIKETAWVRIGVNVLINLMPYGKAFIRILTKWNICFSLVSLK